MSCNQNGQLDKKLKSISNYTYAKSGLSEDVTIKHEMFENGYRMSKYSELIKRKFDSNEKLLEESIFNFRDEVAVLTRYKRNQYNDRGQLLTALDSTKMVCLNHQYNYSTDYLLISSKLTGELLEPKLRDGKEVWLPVNTTTENFIYGYRGKNLITTTRITSETGKFDSRDNDGSDTVIIHHTYDNDNKIQSVFISKNDTISIIKNEYDIFHNQTKTATIQRGEKIRQSKCIFDEKGNVVSSTTISLLSETLQMTYDNDNRISTKESYRIK